MIKILFICHGSICRSPMAKYIMTDLVEKAGYGDEFLIDSAATSSEELGNPVYPPARAILKSHGIDCSGYAARRMRFEDYEEYDLIIGMDSENMYYMRRMWKEDPEGKLRLLLDYSKSPREVSDPWYTRDFETAYNDILEGCTCLLSAIK